MTECGKARRSSGGSASQSAHIPSGQASMSGISSLAFCNASGSQRVRRAPGRPHSMQRSSLIVSCIVHFPLFRRLVIYRVEKMSPTGFFGRCEPILPVAQRPNSELVLLAVGTPLDLVREINAAEVRNG